MALRPPPEETAQPPISPRMDAFQDYVKQAPTDQLIVLNHTLELAQIHATEFWHAYYYTNSDFLRIVWAEITHRENMGFATQKS